MDLFKEITKGLYIGCLEFTDDTFLFVTVALLNIVIWISTVYGGVVLIDQFYKVSYIEQLTLTNKIYTEEYTTLVMSGNVMVPIIYPDSWSIYFGDTVSCEVGKSFYDTVGIGKPYQVTYDKGISGMTYCTSIGGGNSER